MVNTGRLARIVVIALGLLGVASLAWAQAPAGKPAAAGDEFSYLVQPGDTVSGIARAMLVDGERRETVLRLARHNGLKDPDKVAPGATLRMPHAWLRREAAGVIALSVTGDVRSAGQPLKAGDHVLEGSLVTSGAKSYATLEFADKSVVTLREGTSLRIEVHKRNPKLAEFETRLRLGAGEVEAVVSRQRAPNFRIYAPTGNIAVRGTKYRVRGGEDVNMFEVLEGSLSVSGEAGGNVSVGAGFGTAVRKGEPPITPVRLLDAPDISGIARLHEAATVRLRVPPMEGAASYYFRAATDRDFRDMVMESVQRRPEVRIVDLRDAEYFYGVRAIDANGLHGKEAQGRFRLVRPPMPEPAPQPALEPAPDPAQPAAPQQKP